MMIKKSGGPLQWILYATFLGAYMSTLKLISDLQNSVQPVNHTLIDVNMKFKLSNLLNTIPTIDADASEQLINNESPIEARNLADPLRALSDEQQHHDAPNLTLSEYLHYDEMTKYLHDMEASHPDLIRIYSIGRSVKGRQLWVALITEDVRNDELHLLRPNVKYVANMHGDETIGRELMLKLIDYFVESYHRYDEDAGADKFRLLARDLVKTMRIHLMPSMNPDGFESSTEGVCEGGARENANGFDLNRNFPDFIRNISSNETQPETRAIEVWLDKIPFVLSANLHGGSLVACYPNDDGPVNEKPNTLSVGQDIDIFRHLALVYSKAHTKMHLGKPCPGESGFPQGITNGNKWYPVEGGMQDYNYYFEGCMEITIELSCCKYPPATELKSYWMDNKKALLDYLNEANRGVRGLIYNAVTNEPITGSRIQLAIKGRELGKFHSSDRAEFWRVLLPGNYVLEVNAEGYEPIEQPFIVENQEHTFLKVYLKPL